VVRAVARWVGVASSRVTIVSGAAGRRKLAEIEREGDLLRRLYDRLSAAIT
jgi:uncharacterized protein YggU (UPF0235/DUF167 family)